jgi:hypothetical protein
MSEQTFRSPGFFEREIDLSPRQVSVSGVPAGVIGTAEQGPAFVPVTVGSLLDFQNKFGALHPERYGPYAVNEFLKHQTAATYVRVLGAGANETSSDMTITELQGTVKNAGFRIKSSVAKDSAGPSGTPWTHSLAKGSVRFIAAVHDASSEETSVFPQFSLNDSFDDVSAMNIVRGMVLLASGTSLLVNSETNPIYQQTTNSDDGSFNVVVATTGAPTKTHKVSLDPRSTNYLSKVLNTDPLKFQSEGYVLYADFPVEEEVATTKNKAVTILAGKGSYLDSFGRFDTRYSTPKTTNFISQPYGDVEYDLFHFETLSDGAWGNDKFKVSIANLRASTDPSNPYGTFEVQIRNFDDVDTNPQILESYPECSLNPDSENYIARKIGDYKVYYDFDQVEEKDRRLIVKGRYGNKSPRIRIVIHEDVEQGRVPKTALPFGFRGLPVIRLTDDIVDTSNNSRVTTIINNDANILLAQAAESSSVVKVNLPPIPFKYKVTRGEMDPAQTGFRGTPGRLERIDSRQYWGVMTKRLPQVSNSILKPNEGNVDNALVKSYTKFMGIPKLGNLFTDDLADKYSNNKFTLARVALLESLEDSNASSDKSLEGRIKYAIEDSANTHMLKAIYYRDGVVDNKNYTIYEEYQSDPADPLTLETRNRFTFASLFHGDAITFNRFTPFAKFTNIFHGGFDGFNILDKDVVYFKEKALSIVSDGKAKDGVINNGLNAIEAGKNQAGYAQSNNSINSITKAIDIITDSMSSSINILATPGVREELVTQYAMDKVRDYSLALYVLDIIKYDENRARIYDDSKQKPDVRATSEIFEARALDNNYAATYFPDVVINDLITGRNIKVPASIAALGTLAFNDRDKAPWYAPAGFNRGSLDFVRNVETRLSAGDRDVLYDARINPIASFPNADFVIFGQKTLQQAKTALDRVNVRRLLLEVKRQISSVANGLLFEPNTSATRARFISSVTPLLGAIQLQAGIEQFRVVMDDTNNTQDDVDNHRLNGRIVIVPTRAVEFVAIDFIITNSGVNFA